MEIDAAFVSVSAPVILSQNFTPAADFAHQSSRGQQSASRNARSLVFRYTQDSSRFGQFSAVDSFKRKFMVQTMPASEVDVPGQSSIKAESATQAAPTSSKSWYSDIPQAPEDPILGVTVAFNADKDPSKLSLGVGAYRTEEGKPYVLNVVKKVEQQIVHSGANKEYLPIEGLADFRARSAELIFGKDSPALKAGKVVTVQALSGTGALRIAAEFLGKYFPDKTVYLSTPTWGNHKNIFPRGGLPIGWYRYYNDKANALDLKGFLEDIKNAPDQSIFLLHGCAHNPTGMDPTHEQWRQIADAIKENGHIALFDVAYQGFASGDVNADAWSVRYFVESGVPVMVTQSYAKNMGLYGERVGALSVVCESADEAKRVLSQLKSLIRPMYSNPPVHGARIAAAILADPALLDEWCVELKGMADRIIRMRALLFDALKANGTPGTWIHIVDQIGMFSFTGLTAPQVKRITEEHHVYMTSDGRISMAGLSAATVPKLADAMREVITAVPPS